MSCLRFAERSVGGGFGGTGKGLGAGRGSVQMNGGLRVGDTGLTCNLDHGPTSMVVLVKHA